MGILLLLVVISPSAHLPRGPASSTKRMVGTRGTSTATPFTEFVAPFTWAQGVQYVMNTLITSNHHHVMVISYDLINGI